MEQTYLTASKTKDYDPPYLANFIVMMMMMIVPFLKVLCANANITHIGDVHMHDALK